MTQPIKAIQTEFDFTIPLTSPNTSSQQPEPTKEKRKYTQTEKAIQSRLNQIKQFDLSNVNLKYLESFRNFKYPNFDTDLKQKSSWAQYKCSCGNLMESLNKDAITINQSGLDNFLSNITNENTRANRLAHIKSMLTFILHKNISFCRQRASTFVLVFTDTVPAWFLNDKTMIKHIAGNEQMKRDQNQY